MRAIQKILFFLLLILIPTQLALHFWPDWALVLGARVDYLAPKLYLTDLLIFSLVFLDYKKLAAVVVNNKLKAIGILGFALTNIFFADNPFVAIFQWVKLSEFLLLGLWINSNKNFVVLHLPKSLSIALIYTTAIAIAQFVMGRSIGGLLYWLGERPLAANMPGISLQTIFSQTHLRPYATFAHPNALAGFALVAFLILLSQNKKSALIKISLICALLLIILSFSQSAWIALLICVIFLVVRNNGFKNVFAKMVLFLGLIATLGFLIFSWNAYKSGFRAMPLSVQSRAALAVVSGHLLAQSPIFGVGLNNLIPHMPLVVEVLPTLFSGVRFAYLQPVHNIFLLVFSELGIVGLFVFIWIFAFAMKHKNLYTVAVLAILVTGLFDHYWLTLQQNQILLTLVLALAI